MVVLSLRRSTVGRDKGSVSELTLLERAITAAQAAGVDAAKLKTAREVLESKGKKLQPYLHICLPMYFASLVLCAALETWPLRMIVPGVLMLIVGKVGLMSV